MIQSNSLGTSLAMLSSFNCQTAKRLEMLFEFAHGRASSLQLLHGVFEGLIVAGIGDRVRHFVQQDFLQVCVVGAVLIDVNQATPKKARALVRVLVIDKRNLPSD